MSKAWLRDLEEKVQEAAGRLQEQKAANQTLQEQNGELETRVEELEGQVAELEEQVTGLETQVAELEARPEGSGGGSDAEWLEEREEIQRRVEKLVGHLTGLLSEEEA